MSIELEEIEPLAMSSNLIALLGASRILCLIGGRSRSWSPGIFRSSESKNHSDNDWTNALNVGRHDYCHLVTVSVKRG